jgi:hypothetical protein
MADISERSAAVTHGDDAARGAVTGHGVRYVLAAGLALVILAFLTIPIFV